MNCADTKSGRWNIHNYSLLWLCCGREKGKGREEVYVVILRAFQFCISLLSAF